MEQRQILLSYQADVKPRDFLFQSELAFKIANEWVARSYGGPKDSFFLRRKFNTEFSGLVKRDFQNLNIYPDLSSDEV